VTAAALRRGEKRRGKKKRVAYLVFVAVLSCRYSAMAVKGDVCLFLVQQRVDAAVERLSIALEDRR